jgi:hypothetical protein
MAVFKSPTYQVIRRPIDPALVDSIEMPTVAARDIPTDIQATARIYEIPTEIVISGCCLLFAFFNHRGGGAVNYGSKSKKIYHP